jgi:hypothetical protein
VLMGFILVFTTLTANSAAMPSRLGGHGERQGCQVAAMLPFGFAGDEFGRLD